MHNHDIIFDNENKRIGLVSSECDRANGNFNFNNRDNENIVKPISSTCDNNSAIRFYIFMCIVAGVSVFVVIALFAYAVRKLRRDGKFLWISLNDDIGNTTFQ